MNEQQARTVRNFLEVLLHVKLLNCWVELWVEPSDEIVDGGWAVYLNFNSNDECRIRHIAELQATEFWEKLLTMANEPV